MSGSGPGFRFIEQAPRSRGAGFPTGPGFRVPAGSPARGPHDGRRTEPAVNIKTLECLLPPPARRARRWDLFACQACGDCFRIDRRVHRLPLVPALRRAGMVRTVCPDCGAGDVLLLGWQSA